MSADFVPTADDWADLKARLVKANDALLDHSSYGPIGASAVAQQKRRNEKASGVRLALSYMGEYERQDRS